MVDTQASLRTSDLQRSHCPARGSIVEIMSTRLPSLANELCALCSKGNSERDGEHVVPDWLMRDMTVEVDQTSNDPSPDRGSRRPFGDIRLPCCRPCNNELNRRFENPGVDPAKALLADRVETLPGKRAERSALGP